MPDNVILIMTDQQRRDTLSCYGGHDCETPNIDELARDGVVFENTYTTCAVCSPARASLQTGLYPHNHGFESNTYGNGCRVNELPDTPELLSRRLQAAGYGIGFTGKWHLGYGDAEAKARSWEWETLCTKWNPGLARMFPDWYLSNGTLPSDVGYEGDDFPGHGDGGYNDPLFHRYLEKNGLSFDLQGRDDYGGFGYTITGEVVSGKESTIEHFLADRAISLIEDFVGRDKPFVVQLHIWGPHTPFYAPTEFLDLYRDKQFSQWPNFSHPATAAPEFHGVFRRADKPWSYFNNALRFYYAMMTSIDYEVGRVIKRLQELGVYDRTNIIFTTDHGDSHGAHNGLENKSYHAFEETTHIPLIIKPALDDQDRGELPRTEPRFANTADLYSTVLDMCDVPRQIAERDGRSLVPLVRGESRVAWPEVCVTHGLSATALLCSHRMLRWDKYKYVFYSSGTDELYDLDADPWELENLVNEKTSSSVLTECRFRLAQWMSEKGDKALRDFCVLRNIDRAEL
jgi:arylsulfatase A-like enzyme